MNTSTKAMMAAIQAAFLAIVPLALADGSYAADTGEETEYDTDLGEFWSMTIGFSYSGEGARSVTWDFGDGSEPVTAFSEIHTFENKGVYYVTQTAHNTNGDSVAVYKVTVLGYPYVEFDTQGGSDIARIDMTSGGINATAATEPEEVPTKTGFTFTGWYTTPECEELYDWTSIVSEPVKVYAGWSENAKANIVFDVDEGYPPVETVQWTIGTEYTIPGYDGTKDGYTFGGWSYNGQTYLEGQKITVTGDMTLTAVWNELDRYTVSFDLAGGTGTFPAQTVYVNGTATEPETEPTKTGHTFAGWYLGDEPYVFTTPVNGNITLTAHWTRIATYTVSFDSGVGPSVPARTVPAGTAIVLPTIAQSGHVFKGWQSGEEILQPGQSFTPTSDVKLTAVWEVIDQRHTVTFDDGENQNKITVKHNGRVSPVKDPVRDGFEFKGWLLDGEPYDFSTRITADMTLTAQWEELPPRIVVDKDIPGDVVMTEPIPDDVAEGDEIRLPEASRPGQSFQGWDTDGDRVVDVEANGTVVYEEGMKLEPIFEEIDPDTQHKVTIEDAPEIPFEDWYVEEDKPIVLPDIPREDETLVGYEDQDGNRYDVGEEFAPTEDVTLKPVFEPKEPVKVSVTVGEDAVLSSTFPGTLYVGSFVTLPDASRQGYELEGWDVAFGDVSMMALHQPGDVVEVMGDMTVTAVWRELTDEIQNEVVMDSPDGDMPFDSWYEVDGNPVTLPEVSDGDRHVVGYEDEDGNVLEPGSQFYPSGDTTLKVVWSDSGESGDDGSGTDWWIYSAVVIVILALIALVLILHFRVGVI